MSSLWNSGPLSPHLGGILALVCCVGALAWGHFSTPTDERRSFWQALLVSSVTGVLITVLGVVVLKNYGLGIFIGLPFYCGLLSTFLYSYRKPQPFGKILKISILTIVLLGLLILILAVDGVICLLMALPLALPLAIAGGVAGSALASRSRAKRGISAVLPVLVLCGSLPFLVGVESWADLESPSSTVVTTMDINASAETVWKYVPAFSPIEEQPAFLFRLGVAYPMESRIEGSGVGARRKCVLSTGDLEERVEVWQPGRELRFTVLSCPPSMQETSLYPNLHPAHLDNYYVSEWGDFRLVKLTANCTRLIGTSHYHNRMWPAQYWLPIADNIVHQIHSRVLETIRARAERDESARIQPASLARSSP